jgi:hypothetical protein
MNLGFTRGALLFTVALGFSLMMSGPAWPGGDAGDADDHSQDDGPRFFGFVKDTSGKIVPDAKVTADVKGLGSIVSRSDRLGTYKMPALGKHISPDNVTISCSKDGYKQVRALRRTAPAKNLKAIETECVMQRVAK